VGFIEGYIVDGKGRSSKQEVGNHRLVGGMRASRVMGEALLIEALGETV